MVDLPCFCLALGVPQWEGGGSYPGTLGLMLASSFVKNCLLFCCQCLHQSLYISPYSLIELPWLICNVLASYSVRS